MKPFRPKFTEIKLNLVKIQFVSMTFQP
jgi:hypothetical protein